MWWLSPTRFNPSGNRGGSWK